MNLAGRGRDDTLVLCYHAIHGGWDAPLAVPPSAFDEQMSLLAERGYRGVTFSEAVTGRSGGKTLAVTFDDAYRSVFDLAFPTLERLGFVATVFVPTAFPGTGRPMAWPGIDQWTGGPFELELVPMGWPELRTLSDQGWELGSHTRTHPHLTQLGDAELDRELRESKRDCEEGAGRPCPAVAYPYGDHDDRVVSAARAAGYAAGAALPSRLEGADPLRWPRIGIYQTDDLRRFRRKVSPALRLLRASPLWSVVDR